MTDTSSHAARSTAGQPSEPLLPRKGLSIRVVGLGGTGGIAARYLCVYLASLNWPARVVFVDGDAFEHGNATRALFSCLGNKAEVARADLLEYFADSQLTLVAVDQYLSPENIARLLPGGDHEYVVLCVDNHGTRKLVSDYCAGRNGWPGVDDICLISAGNDPVGQDSRGRMLHGTFGNCQVFLRHRGRNVTPSLTELHTEIDAAEDRLPGDADCTEMLDATPQLLFANLTSASAICNTFWLCLCRSLHYSELIFDVAQGLMQPTSVPGPPGGWPPDRDGVRSRTQPHVEPA